MAFKPDPMEQAFSEWAAEERTYRDMRGNEQRAFIAGYRSGVAAATTQSPALAEHNRKTRELTAKIAAHVPEIDSAEVLWLDFRDTLEAMVEALTGTDDPEWQKAMFDKAGPKPSDFCRKLREQRDALLAACQHVFEMIEVELYESPEDDQWHIAAKKLQAAIEPAKDDLS